MHTSIRACCLTSWSTGTVATSQTINSVFVILHLQEEKVEVEVTKLVRTSFVHQGTNGIGLVILLGSFKMFTCSVYRTMCTLELRSYIKLLQNVDIINLM